MASIRKVILDEYFEPVYGKAVRTTLAFILPLLWGYLTNHLGQAVWISITAQLLSMTSLRGGYLQRILLYAIVAVLAAIAAFLGMMVSQNIWLAVLCMFALAFFCGYIRQAGDYGPGLTLTILLLYLLGTDYSIPLPAALKLSLFVLSGGAAAILFLLLAWPFIPLNPFRRSVALTWKALAEWLEVFAQNFESLTKTEIAASLDEKELQLRQAISQSMEVLNRRQLKSDKHQSFHIVELRRIASLLGSSVAAIRTAFDYIYAHADKQEIPENVLNNILEVMSQASYRIALAVISNKKEDAYVAKLRVTRVERLINSFLRKNVSATAKPDFGFGGTLSDPLLQALDYLKEAAEQLDELYKNQQGNYLFIRNVLEGVSIPQPLPMIRFEFSRHSFLFRFSLRLALGMAIGMLLFKLFDIPHGYWIAMTVMIVLQPEFGATFTKAGNRMKGTVLGALAATVLLMLNLPPVVSMIILTFSAFMMAFYLNKNYAIAVFFITINLIMLFHILAPISWTLAAIRLGNTIIGVGLALLAGYAFWPIWEKYRFPALLQQGLRINQRYLNTVVLALEKGTPLSQEHFIKIRREAEIAGNNAFDSVRRMPDEPKHQQLDIPKAYALAAHNLRISRETTALITRMNRYEFKGYFSCLRQYREAAERAFAILITMAENEGVADEWPDLPQLLKQLHTDICVSIIADAATHPARYFENHLSVIIEELMALRPLLQND